MWLLLLLLQFVVFYWLGSGDEIVIRSIVHSFGQQYKCICMPCWFLLGLICGVYGASVVADVAVCCLLVCCFRCFSVCSVQIQTRYWLYTVVCFYRTEGQSAIKGWIYYRFLPGCCKRRRNTIGFGMTGNDYALVID